MKDSIEKIYNDWNRNGDFSGVFSVRKSQEILFEAVGGYMDIANSLKNNLDTKYAIASGTKIFTAAAVCKLIEQQKLSLNDKVLDILEYNFNHFDRSITVEHLLNHTSGIPDYFDEEFCVDYEAIWDNYPVYKMTELQKFIPLFHEKIMKFTPGTRYSYSNSGFILLGLIIEIVSGQLYQDYVLENIIKPCCMENTGFYRMDMLPRNTAFGYIYDDVLKGWRTNFFSVPIVGSSDGGVYTNAYDMCVFWNNLVNKKLLNEELTNDMLSQKVMVNGKKGIYYGYGVYVLRTNKGASNYFITGGDPGVNFFSAYYIESDIVVTALGNTEKNTFPLLEELNRIILNNYMEEDFNGE